MSEFRQYRPNNFPPIVKNLIIINVLVWIAQQMLDKQYHLTEKIALYPIMPAQLQTILAKSPDFTDYYGFHPFQIATHMFAHGPLYHILFNMFALWMFGRILENVWGPKRFLLFYFVCGIGAAAAHLAVQYFTGGYSAAVGASGALMGIMVAFAYLFPNTDLYLMFIPIAIKAKWAVTAYVVYDLIFGIYGTDNIAHFAHLGGAITGFILVLIWNKTNRKTFY